MEEGRILAIHEIGDPVLKRKAKEIKIRDIKKERELIQDMKATLLYHTGFGIAAPQIGVNKRIIVVQVKKEQCKYKEAEEIPLTAMINPTWIRLSDEKDSEYEGCMSIPVIRAKIERYKMIEVTYFNEEGKKIIKKANGFTARLLQHEMDHLDGYVFLDRVTQSTEFATVSNLARFHLKEKTK